MSERTREKAIERLAEVLYLTRGADPSLHPWSDEPECDRDKYRAVARQALSELLDENASLRAKVANRDAEISRLRAQTVHEPKPAPVGAVLCPACGTETHFEGTVLCCSGCGRSRRMRHG